jgi:TRAP-type C4-dicarboxylate transport system substrate-binding protein
MEMQQNKVESFLSDVINKLHDLRSSESETNTAFSDFFYFFNQKFDELNEDEKKIVLSIFERDRKLKDLLGN